MGRFLSVGRLVNTKGITVTEATRIGENGGTLDELLIRSPVDQVQLEEVLGLNPEF